MKMSAIAIGLALAVLGLAAGQVRAGDVMTDPPPAGYYAMQKVVYQNDGGLPDNPTYFKFILRNIANHIEATGGKVEIRVVDFGPGVTLLVLAKTDPALAASIDGLRAKGVRFLVCRNTLKGMKLTPADLYKVPDTDVVPAGVAELARLQGMGFVLVHP